MRGRCLCVCLLLAGCASQNADLTRTAPGPEAELSSAYSLLYELVCDESDVSDLFIVRSVAEPTRAIAKDIAATCTYARKELEDFAKADEHLRLDAAGLPEAEAAARGVITGWETKRMLFGDHLDRDLLLNQCEATKYGAALAQHVASIDADEHRKQRMEALSKKLLELNDQIRRQLEALTLSPR